MSPQVWLSDRRSRMFKAHRIGLAAWLVLAGGAVADTPDVALEKDCVLGRGGDVELNTARARPAGEGPSPLVVCIHGGAWRLGNRTAHHGTVRLLARHGYVAATVQYRLTPKHPFPAQVEDVKCAV